MITVLEELQSENEKLKKQIVDAMSDIPHECATCLFHDIYNINVKKDNNPCWYCKNNKYWKWRGDKEKA